MWGLSSFDGSLTSAKARAYGDAKTGPPIA